MFSTDPSQDYVDDSEPERKRIRKAEHAKRKIRQKQSTNSLGVQLNSLHSLFLRSSVTDAVCCPEGLDGVLTEVTPVFVDNYVIGPFRVPLKFYEKIDLYDRRRITRRYQTAFNTGVLSTSASQVSS